MGILQQKKLLLGIFISIVFISFGQRKEADVLNGLPHIGHMVYLSGGQFIERPLPVKYPSFTTNDSDLLSCTQVRRITVRPFYICDHEVTNAEYREFVNWVRDSIMQAHPEDPSFCYLKEGFGNKKEYNTELFIYHDCCIFPDVSCLNRNSDPLNGMSSLYFEVKTYDDFPVVGVNWHQAMAYCRWKTMRLKEELNRGNKKPALCFRLPTNAEWEYAAFASKADDGKAVVKYYPWEGLSLLDAKGKFRCNMGTVVDQNGMPVLPSAANCRPTKIKSYAPNSFGLYDMAGNVSEWVLDDKPFDGKDSLDTEMQKYYAQVWNQLQSYSSSIRKMEVVNKMLQEKMGEQRRMSQSSAVVPDETDHFPMEYGVLLKIRNELICQHPDSRIVKGGSWADGAIYQQCVSRELLNSQTTRTTLGFRIAIGIQPQ